MFMYSQYGEGEIFVNFFENKRDGVVVDIGAFDGLTYSNSRFLVEHLGWRGLLVEPDPESFISLQKLYKNDDKVSTRNVACFNKETTVDFHINGMSSTMSEEFKEKVIKIGEQFKKEPIKMQTVTLDSLLSEYDHVDLLSVDCEGVDMEVLESNDWSKNRPSLLCIEHSMDESELREFADNIGYTQHAKTTGNTLFKAEPKR